jgi:hypothetical protein
MSHQGVSPDSLMQKSGDSERKLPTCDKFTTINCQPVCTSTQTTGCTEARTPNTPDPLRYENNLQISDFSPSQGLIQQHSINNDELFKDLIEPVKFEKSQNKDASTFAQDFAQMMKIDEDASPEGQARLA